MRENDFNQCDVVLLINRYLDEKRYRDASLVFESMRKSDNASTKSIYEIGKRFLDANYNDIAYEAFEMLSCDGYENDEYVGMSSFELGKIYEKTYGGGDFLIASAYYEKAIECGIEKAKEYLEILKKRY